MNVIPVTIDRGSPIPLYHQLAEQLTASIEDGRLKPGDPFENELALADRLDLSRPTVRRAIAELVSRGLLVRRRGVGTTVASQVIHWQNGQLTNLLNHCNGTFDCSTQFDCLAVEPTTAARRNTWGAVKALYR